MKRHPYALLVMLVGCGTWGSTAAAQTSAAMAAATAGRQAQSALVLAASAAPKRIITLPPGFDQIQSATSLSDDQLASLREFVRQQVAALGGTDNAARSTARDLLCDAATSGANATPTPAFLESYSGMVSDSLVPLVKSPKMRVRLNAGVVAARIAERAGNSRMAVLAATLVKDNSAAVALWGVRCAKGVLPTMLRDNLPGKETPLLKALVPVAKKFDTGEITYEVYDALSMTDCAGQTAPELLSLFAYRVQKYARAVPEVPKAENRATLFLADMKVWTGLPRDQQVQAVQCMVDMLNALTQRAMNARPRERATLNDLIAQTGKAVWVVGDWLQDDAIREATIPLQRPIPYPGFQLNQAVANLQVAVKANAAFQDARFTPAAAKPGKMELLDTSARPPAGTETEDDNESDSSDSDSSPDQ